MDLRPTIIIGSLIGTLIVVVVMAFLHRILCTRQHQRRAMRDPIEAEVPVRKFIVREGRVVPYSCKPTGTPDLSRTWTARLSWSPRDTNRAHVDKRAQRLPPSTQLSWPLSKYNSMRQHNPMKKRLEDSDRKIDTREYPAAKEYSTREYNSKTLGRLDTQSLRVPKPPAASGRKPRRSRAETGSDSNIAHVRRLAKSLERAYAGPSSQKTHEVAFSPPAIVITQDPLTQPHSRGKGRLVGTGKCDVRFMPNEAIRDSKKEDPQSQGLNSSNLQLPTEQSTEVGQRRKNEGQSAAIFTPMSPLHTNAAIATPTRDQPSPDVPLPLFHSVDPRMLQTHRSLVRSQNTLRSKHATRPGHRPGRLARIDTNVPRSTHTSFLEYVPPSAKDAGDARQGHSLMSPKSTATFASSDMSDSYTLGKAMPVPILATSKSPSGWIAKIDKALPKLPVKEVLDPEEDAAQGVERSKTRKENQVPQRGTRSAATEIERPGGVGVRKDFSMREKVAEMRLERFTDTKVIC